MPIIKIEDKEYDFDSLSSAAKEHIQTMQFVDAELIRTKAQLAVLQTARNSYAQALKQLLATDPQPFPQSDTIKFG